jgi:anti-anti-sigma factor
VAVSGELDLATCPELHKTLTDLVGDSERQVILDLEHLDFMDLSGLAVIEDFAEQIAAIDGEFVLERPNPTVRYLIDFGKRFAPTDRDRSIQEVGCRSQPHQRRS